MLKTETKEIVKITLENEMDLILAHKRSMKMAELCGMSLSVQTYFATAVSEISRCALNNPDKSYLVLGIDFQKNNQKQLLAAISNATEVCNEKSEAVSYARRLVKELQIIHKPIGSEIRLYHPIPFSGLITESKIEQLLLHFKKEPAISAYDEIRKKNMQLIELSEKFQKSEQQYRSLTDTLPLMMFSINNTGKVMYANKGLQDFFQLSGSQLTNLSLESMLMPEDLKKVFQEWEKSKQTNAIFRAETRLKGKDQNVWHLVSIIPLKIENEITLSWTGFFVDIHAQKQVEETLKNNVELKETQKQLYKNQRQLESKITELNLSNHDLEQFAYIASHDLQEPLRKIRSFSELLERNLGTDNITKSKNFLAKIDSSAQRMSTLIKDVLNYSRLSKKAVAFSDTDLNGIIENIKVDLELLIEQKNVKIEYTDLPTVSGIPLQLHQLFYNLIGNSIKFSDKAPLIQISSRVLRKQEVMENVKMDENFDYFEIILRDNGIGFEQKYAEQIFTIFQRLNDQSKYTGTGIGLALCKKIAENHKGYIKAESTVGVGTSFYIYIQVPEEVTPDVTI